MTCPVRQSKRRVKSVCRISAWRSPSSIGGPARHAFLDATSLVRIKPDSLGRTDIQQGRNFPARERWRQLPRNADRDDYFRVLKNAVREYYLADPSNPFQQ